LSSSEYQNLTPSLTYHVTQSGPNQFTVSGVVTDEDPELTNVIVSGVGNGSVAPDVNGNYSFIFTSAQPGGIRISAVDKSGSGSEPLSSLLPNMPPVIVPFFSTQNGNWWTLRGHVIDEAPAGLVVVFHSSIAAIDGHTTTVLSNGDFAEPFFLKFGVSGLVTAQTTDWFGLPSNVPETWVG
jgi:hypothetical protein